jgi:hypothetical protein
LLEFKLHGKLATAPESSADLGRRLVLCEATCPRGEEAVTAEVMELGQDRDHGVIGSLDGKIVEIAARGVSERRRSAPDLEPCLTIEKRVQATNRLVTAQPVRMQRLYPGLRLWIEVPYAKALCLGAVQDDDVGYLRRSSARSRIRGRRNAPIEQPVILRCVLDTRALSGELAVNLGNTGLHLDGCRRLRARLLTRAQAALG